MEFAKSLKLAFKSWRVKLTGFALLGLLAIQGLVAIAKGQDILEAGKLVWTLLATPWFALIFLVSMAWVLFSGLQRIAEAAREGALSAENEKSELLAAAMAGVDEGLKAASTDLSSKADQIAERTTTLADQVVKLDEEIRSAIRPGIGIVDELTSYAELKRKAQLIVGLSKPINDLEETLNRETPDTMSVNEPSNSIEFGLHQLHQEFDLEPLTSKPSRPKATFLPRPPEARAMAPDIFDREKSGPYFEHMAKEISDARRVQKDAAIRLASELSNIPLKHASFVTGLRIQS